MKIIQKQFMITIDRLFFDLYRLFMDTEQNNVCLQHNGKFEQNDIIYSF